MSDLTTLASLFPFMFDLKEREGLAMIGMMVTCSTG